MELVLSQLGAGRLRRFDGRLPSGMHVVLCAAPAGGGELVAVVCGAAVVERGSGGWAS